MHIHTPPTHLPPPLASPSQNCLPHCLLLFHSPSLPHLPTTLPATCLYPVYVSFCYLQQAPARHLPACMAAASLYSASGVCACPLSSAHRCLPSPALPYSAVSWHGRDHTSACKHGSAACLLLLSGVCLLSQPAISLGCSLLYAFSACWDGGRENSS